MSTLSPAPAPQRTQAYALVDRQVDVETPEHVSVGYELADLGSRFTAMLLDIVIVSILSAVAVIGFLVIGAASEGILGGGGEVAIAVGLMAAFVFYWGYYV